MKEALGGIYIFPYRTITLPNVLKIRILAARKLADLPNLKPRVEVTLRTTKLSTPSAERVESSTGAVEYRFDSDMIIPAEYAERDGVLVVRVYNDNVGLMGRPRLIGQWFMTLKYLVMFPTYCKHSKIVAPGDGSIAGTFLLTDAKLQGSAMRDREAWDLGRGFSGELDMAMHYTRSELLEPRPPQKAMGALAQMGQFPDEDKLKIGNTTELKQTLSKLPILFDIEFFNVRDHRPHSARKHTTHHCMRARVLTACLACTVCPLQVRDATVEISDLFIGAATGKKKVAAAHPSAIQPLPNSRLFPVSHSPPL